MATAKQTKAARKNVARARELYELAKQRDLPGRSKMGRAELARRLGEK
jgi:hypothetical protein